MEYPEFMTICLYDLTGKPGQEIRILNVEVENGVVRGALGTGKQVAYPLHRVFEIKEA